MTQYKTHNILFAFFHIVYENHSMIILKHSSHVN